MSLVDIVIPAHNAEKTLFRAVKSCFRQKKISSNDINVIVIDDSSIDGTVNIAESIKKIYPMKLLRLHQNSGPAAARNAGINKTRSKYVAFLDADDEMHSERLSIQLQVLYNNPEIGFVISGIRERHGKGVRVIVRKTPTTQIDFFHQVFVGNLRSLIPTFTIDRKCMIETLKGFDERLNYLEDREFILRAIHYIGGLYLPVALVDRWIQSEGLTEKAPVEIIEASRKKFITIVNEWYKPSPALKRRFWAMTYSGIASKLARSGSVSLAVCYALRSLMNYPSFRSLFWIRHLMIFLSRSIRRAI